MKFFQRRRNQVFIIVLATLLAYLNIFQNGFAWDDGDFLINWPQIKSREELPSYLSLPDLLKGDLPLDHRGIYRPVRSVIYLASYSVWGENPFGYHLQAIIIHLLVALVIYLITEKITGKRGLAFITALLFATHPIHTESVTYITASFDTLGILFFFLSFYFYLKIGEVKSKKTIVLLASVIYAFLAFFTYEMTLVLPILIILYDFSAQKFLFRKLIPKINLYKYYFFGLVLYGLVRFVILGIGNRADYLGKTWIIAANQARVSMPETFLQYFQLLLWPVNLTIGHELSINILLGYLNILKKIDPTETLINLSTKIAWLFPLVYSLLTLFVIYKIFKKFPLVFFGLSWLIIALLPASSIIPQGATMAERYLYIPSFGFILLLGFIFYHGFLFLHQNRSVFFKRLSYGFMLLIILTNVFYIYQTIKRNKDWKDDNSLWQAAINTDPLYPRPYAALATVYVKQDKYDLGIDLYKKALELTEDAKIHSDLGLAFNLKGETDKAMAEQRIALSINPGYFPARIALGHIYLKKGDYEMAEKEYKGALEVRNHDPLLLSYLGNVYYNQKNYTEALNIYRQAFNLQPNSPEISYQLGLAYAKLSKYDQAIEVFNKSLSLNPKQTLVYLSLASAYKLKGEVDNAVNILKSGLQYSRDQRLQNELNLLVGNKIN